jgi:hypothetical protein
MIAFLFIVAMAMPTESEPVFAAVFPDMETCHKAARLANENDPKLKDPRLKPYKPMYVCMKPVQDTI